MTYRQAAGRKMVAYKSRIPPRDMLRRFVRRSGHQIKDLAGWWDISPTSVYRLLCDKNRPLSPQYYEIAAKKLDLTHKETQLLLIAGAREAGWNVEHD